MRRKNRPVKHGPTRPKIRRQWGTERRAGAAPVMHPVPSRRAMSGARFALFLTIAAWVAYFGEQVRRYVDHPFGVRGTVEAVVYLLLVTLLTASAVGYLLARLGHLQRVRAHRREPRAVIDEAFDESNPTLTVIVPSYREEPRVVRQTLLSAALQEYPGLRVVAPDRRPAATRATPRSSSSLESARALPGEIDALLERPAALRGGARRLRVDRRLAGHEPVAEDLELLAATYDDAVAWLRDMADGEDVVDHADAFLVDEVVLAPRRRPRRPTPRPCATHRRGRAEISAARMRQLYRRLVWIFRAELIELRAQALRLALARAEQGDEPQQLHRPDGRPLPRSARPPAARSTFRCAAATFDLDGPRPRLRAHARRRQHAAAGVLPAARRLHASSPRTPTSRSSQTPYSAYRGAPTRLERIAGATTDLQHIVHQGMTHYGATFWVGANAVLRKPRSTTSWSRSRTTGFTDPPLHPGPHGHRGHRVDASTCASTAGGSTTTPSGSATAPRRPTSARCASSAQRWANGGLLILPKLLRLMRAGASGDRAAPSPSRGSCGSTTSRRSAGRASGLVLLLFYPFDELAAVALAVLTALPYFVAIVDRPAPLRLQAARRLAALRAQPDAAAGQHGRRGCARSARRSAARRAPSPAPRRCASAPSRRSRSWRSRS